MPKSPDDQTKKSLISRLRRLEGQLRGITGMLEANRNKKDILIQLSAVRAGVSSAEIALVESIIKKADATADNENDIKISQQDLDTILRLIKR